MYINKGARVRGEVREREHVGGGDGRYLYISKHYLCTLEERQHAYKREYMHQLPSMYSYV